MPTKIDEAHALKYFQLVENRDYDGLRRLLSDDKFKQEFRPASLGGLGVPTRNKEEFMMFVEVDLPGILTVLNFKFPPRQVVIADRVAVVHIFTSSTTIRGTALEGEFIFIFEFDEDGKLVSIQEFMDSKAVAEEMAAQADFTKTRASSNTD